MISGSRNGLTRRDLLCRGVVGAAGLICLPPLLGNSSVARAQSSGGYPTPLSGKGQWEANAREWGGYVKAYLERNQATEAGQLATYYDFMRVAFQNGDYFGDPNTWNAAAVTARGPYRDFYVMGVDQDSGKPINGAIPGYWNFTEGLLQDWLRNRDATSLQALRLIRQNGAYVNSTVQNDSEMVDAGLSRETAYALQCCLNAWRAGDPLDTARVNQLKEFAFGHLDQWFVKKSTYVRPFMVALTSEALIQWNSLTGQETDRLVQALSMAWQWCWDYLWMEDKQALRYTDRIVDERTDMDATPNLSLLEVPVFGWLYHKTGDAGWIQKGDKLFNGGVSVYDQYGSHVSGAYLGTRSATNPAGKIFNQCYRWSADYIRWREGSTVTVAPKCLSVTPASASVQVNKPFTLSAKYEGSQLTNVYLMLLDSTGNYFLMVRYDTVGQRLFIQNDAGGWGGGVAPGTSLVLTRTGQGNLHCGGTTALTEGKQTTVNWQISVPACLAGQTRSVLLYCESRSAYDGWRRLGQLTITQ